MSLYFEYPAAMAESNKGPVSSMAWSHSASHPILAVATQAQDGAAISMYNEEGEQLDQPVSISRAGVACSLEWRPEPRAGDGILAMGWDDGAICCWTMRERVLREDTVAHHSPITMLTWSPEGSRLITGDISGTVAVWQCDARGRLVLTHRYKKGNSPVSQIVFRTPPSSKKQGFEDEVSTFVFATDSGDLYLADPLATRCVEVVKIGRAIKALFYWAKRDSIVVIDDPVTLRVFDCTDFSKTKEVKLSVKNEGDVRIAWAGAGLLALVANEQMVRMFDLAGDDSYFLGLSDAGHMAAAGDTVRCVAFNRTTRTLAGGCTLDGRVVFWKFQGKNGADASEADWEVLPPVHSAGSVFNLAWGPGPGTLATSGMRDVSVLNSMELHCKGCQGAAVVQMATDSIFVQLPDGSGKRLQAKIRIKGLDINQHLLVVWNGSKVEVRELESGAMDTVLFDRKATCCALRGEDLWCITGHTLEQCNQAGVVKKKTTFTEPEGMPVLMDLHHDSLAMVMTTGTLRLYDISRSSIKQVVPGRQLREDIPGVIKSIRVNTAGTKISLIVNHDDGSGVLKPDSKLYVYDVELDKVFHYEFGPLAYPVAHAWDADESKLLAVESHHYDTSRDDFGEEGEEGKGGKGGKGHFDADASTLFCTSDCGVLMQDSFGLSKDWSLMGLKVPHILFVVRPTRDEDDEDGGITQYNPKIKKRTMRDFVGLEDANAEAKADLLSFSYFLTIGNMDEAYRAVKRIQSESLWENMAHMCVKTKRLDVAEVCLGNMNNARGAKAVREAKQEPELEARVAMVAIQLDLIADAERLYKECGRWDLLVKLYQASGRWKEALTVCRKHDRIHLKTTHYLYAKHLEAIGETAEAIHHYEESATHKTEVPRMLFDTQHISDLEEYIKSSNDTSLIKWWAQYCESNGQYDEAIHNYTQAKEILALVRVYCYRGEDDTAAEICKSTENAAACYHLARQYESQDKAKEAIAFYKLAKRYNHGTRLAKEHGLDNELMTLALLAGKDSKLDAARYFEAHGNHDKAVLLYQKGGRASRALDLCFRENLFDSLGAIADSLGSETDPALLAKCGHFFMQHKQYAKAVHLFITGGRLEQALELCVEQRVDITEKMAELMTPGKDSMGKEERNSILEKLAVCCHEQGNFHLACKKYTQAGDKIAAMKSLLKSLDTRKIIYYAQMTKKKEIFILAANYLQNLDWHSEPEIMKTIISFYSKAKAMQQLSVFYDACAQVEIDEYRDYEKALGALKEALKFMLKAKDADKEAKLESLDRRMRLVEKYVEARKLVKREPGRMITICNDLLASSDVETAIRVGDVFALLVEYYFSANQMQQAYDAIQQMKQRNIILSPYLDEQTINKIYTSVGQDPGPGTNNGGMDDDDDDDDDLGEEIE